MVLEKAPESPLDCKEIQPVHIKEISPEYSLEGLMLKLKLQYSGYLFVFMQTFHLCMKCSLGISNFLEEISSLSHSSENDSLEKTVMLGKIEGGRRRE